MTGIRDAFNSDFGQTPNISLTGKLTTECLANKPNSEYSDCQVLLSSKVWKY